VVRLRAATKTSYRLVLLLQRRLSGLRYAARMLVSGAIVWLILSVGMKIDPLWGLISAVVVTEVKLESARRAFVSRLLNTLIGCLVAMLFLRLVGAGEWSVLLAMAAATIVSSDLVKVPVSWRIAPITVAIVMLPAYRAHSPQAAMAAAMQRTMEVIIGSAVAVAVSHATAGMFRAKKLVTRARIDSAEPLSADRK